MNKLIQVGGRLIDLSEPQVMGILNCTPDSFYSGSRVQTEKEIAERAVQIIAEGGTMIDVGAFSTRPGAAEVDEYEEMRRLRGALEIVCREAPGAIVSVDTFRPDVARMVVEEYGVAVINDVSEGGVTGIVNTPIEPCEDDCPAMFRMVARLRVPYVLMSVRPTVEETLKVLSGKVQQLRALGQNDIIIDPGFGFGKTLEENYSLLGRLECLHVLGLPLLVGLSRKSMIYKLLEIDPSHALNGTAVLHTIALMKGASILRVHDVREAVEAVRIIHHL